MMGLTIIKDPITRKEWEQFIAKAHQRLKENQINYDFSISNDKGTYVKAKTGAPASYYAFAQDNERTWVELELKSRTSNKKSYAQTEFYSFLKKNYKKETDTNFEITWDPEDRNSSPRHSVSKVFRIKIYIKPKIYLSNAADPAHNRWIDAMLQLIKSFSPLVRTAKL